jgi:hypothetical protein
MWLWRRAGPVARIGAFAVLVALIAFAVVLVPGLRQSSDERSAAEQRERAEQRAERVRQLEAEQRPRVARSASVAPAGAPASARLAARARLMDELTAAILTDARARVRRGELNGRIRRVDCEPFPRSLDDSGADKDLARRRGRFACLAVTAEFSGGAIGHRYRVLADFQTGRYAFCKVTGQPEPSREQLVTTPRACGG